VPCSMINITYDARKNFASLSFLSLTEQKRWAWDVKFCNLVCPSLLVAVNIPLCVLIVVNEDEDA